MKELPMSNSKRSFISNMGFLVDVILTIRFLLEFSTQSKYVLSRIGLQANRLFLL